jgi:hypothetical protein
MAYNKGELFTCLRLHLYDYQMRYMWVASITKKGEIERNLGLLVGFGDR